MHRTVFVDGNQAPPYLVLGNHAPYRVWGIHAPYRVLGNHAPYRVLGNRASVLADGAVKIPFDLHCLVSRNCDSTLYGVCCLVSHSCKNTPLVSIVTSTFLVL